MCVNDQCKVYNLKTLCTHCKTLAQCTNTEVMKTTTQYKQVWWILGLKCLNDCDRANQSCKPLINNWTPNRSKPHYSSKLIRHTRSFKCAEFANVPQSAFSCESWDWPVVLWFVEPTLYLHCYYLHLIQLWLTVTGCFPIDNGCTIYSKEQTHDYLNP